MLVNDYPWGRQAGGGAPRISDSGNVDSRYRKQKYTDNNQHNSDEAGIEEYNPFGRAGAGAPLKTTSGKCITSLQVDPDIRFQKQLKREVEQSLVSTHMCTWYVYCMYGSISIIMCTCKSFHVSGNGIIMYACTCTYRDIKILIKKLKQLKQLLKSNLF